MANVEFILQAVTSKSHAAQLEKVFALPSAHTYLVSVAFVRTAGIAAISSYLETLKSKPRFFVGIRNEITSVQAIRQLFDLGVDLYVVDTAARRPIFHPKLFLSISDTAAKAIIGSANLTHYGLYRNIEAGTVISLDLSVEEDSAFVTEVCTAFEQMRIAHPKHVLRVTSVKMAEQLFTEGRLCDEAIITAPSTLRTASKTRAELPPMSLHSAVIAKNATALKKANSPKSAAVSKRAVKSSINRLVRVWRSKPLKERDLSIPTGRNTNPTGSMGFKQDLTMDINFQHYFRDEVFKELNWAKDPHKPLKERAVASFEIVVENLNFGIFSLQVAHDNNTKSRSYMQHNFTTQLHWGDEAKSIIAKRDLLGRTLSLYKKSVNPPQYLIEID